MDADSIVEVVPEEEMLSVEETRRQFVFETAVPYICGYAEYTPPIRDVLLICATVEKWLIDGTIPPDPTKSKLKVVSDEK